MLKTRLLAVSLLAAATLAGCDSDPFEATEEDVAGTYTATTLTTTVGGITTNQLALGATLVVNLEPNGETSGVLFVPGGGDNGEDLEESMTGTWTLNENTVTFEQTADSFVRDMTFQAERGTLTGEETFGPVTVRVVLRQANVGLGQ